MNFNNNNNKAKRNAKAKENIRNFLNFPPALQQNIFKCKHYKSKGKAEQIPNNIFVFFFFYFYYVLYFFILVLKSL